MGKDFDIIEHTADIGIRAYGADMTGAFANAAKGMFSVITDLDKVEEKLYREIEVTAADKETLLVEWLNELIYIFDVEYLLFKRWEITSLTDTQLIARCYGEKTDKSRHEIKIGIKAATYHMLKVGPDWIEGDYRVQVLLDI